MQDTLSPEMTTAVEEPTTTNTLPADNRALLRWAKEGFGRSSLFLVEVAHSVEDRNLQLDLLVAGSSLAQAADKISHYLAGADATLPAKYFDKAQDHATNIES